MIEDIAFTKVKLPYGWLGNMSPHNAAWHGLTFRTAEAAFQASRFEAQSPVVEKILKEKSPMGAKMVAKKHASDMVVTHCSQEDIQNMYYVLLTKLALNPELRDLLLETGDAAIIEDCSNRKHGSGLFWGAARCENPQTLKWFVKAEGNWEGTNVLGNLWMLIRSRLKKSS
jgi:ribA/ribD-fused uncharacterized protein